MHEERVIGLNRNIKNVHFFFYKLNRYNGQEAFLHRFPLLRVPRLWAPSHSTNM